MPRKKPPAQDMLEDAHGQPVMPALVVRHPNKHVERHVDPYMALEGGAVPSDVPHKPKAPRTHKIKNVEQQDLAEVQRAVRERARRYESYLDALIYTQGDRVEALARVFKVSPTEVLERYHELLTEVQRGATKQTVAETLEQNDLSLSARVKVLRKHLYSEVPAAALKAADMLNELDDKPTTSGTLYEHYVRMVFAEDDV